MTADEQNEIDLLRMAGKRRIAMQKLREFKEWQQVRENDTSFDIVMIGLLRDIIRGTEDELDWLIKSLQQRNETSLMKKLETDMH